MHLCFFQATFFWMFQTGKKTQGKDDDGDDDDDDDDDDDGDDDEDKKSASVKEQKSVANKLTAAEEKVSLSISEFKHIWV